MTDAPELKPCPFCGGKAHMARDADQDGFGYFYSMKCRSCGGQSQEKYARETCPIFFEGVRDAWNTRADIARPAPQPVGDGGWKDVCRDSNGPEICDRPCSRCQKKAREDHERYSAQPVGVKVKPLVWVDARFTNSPRETADTLIGTYEVMQWAGGDFGGSVPAEDPDESGTEFGGATSLEEAKAAAQADYEHRILSALDPQPAMLSREEADQITPSRAAEIILRDDVNLARMAGAMHDGPLGADDHWFSAATPAGGWCVDMARAGLKALIEKEGPADG